MNKVEKQMEDAIDAMILARNKIDSLQTRIKLLEKVVEDANVLYKQLHNVKQVRPRWANDSVCEAMKNVNESIAALGPSAAAALGDNE